MHIPLVRQLGPALVCLIAQFGLAGCTSLKPYWAGEPKPDGSFACEERAGGNLADPTAACATQASQRTANYTLHYVEFDDEGIPFPETELQIDSAIAQIKRELSDAGNCVRLFVYVHGWRHNAAKSDRDVDQFGKFLEQMSGTPGSARSPGQTSCDAPAVVRNAKSPVAPIAAVKGLTVRTLGIYVGWRGQSIHDVPPFVFASFWDRKNTAERVSQGSVRELFARLSAAAQSAGAPAQRGQLRTYVIGHSFGASVVFRAMSQSLIDGFLQGIDDDDGSAAGPGVVPRFVDMAVLVNPAIEAARFAPVFRAATKRAARCPHGVGALGANVCPPPPYQAPVLAIFQSEGDWATHYAFGVGANLGNLFESTLDESEQRAITQTVGWYDEFTTHSLKLDQQCNLPADAQPAAASAPGAHPLYRAPGWRWCFGGYALAHRAAPAPGTLRPTYNGPLWNVRVAPEIVSDHGDIWNDRFREVLKQLFNDERVHPAFVAAPPAAMLAAQSD